jgi:hypothetical protein
MKSNYIEDILQSIGAEDVPADVRKIAEKTSTDFSKILTESEHPKRHIIWEYLSKSQITKLAAVAVIVIAVLFALNIVDDGSSVAWGKVLNNIQKVGAFAYRLKLNMVGIREKKDSVELEAEGWVSEDYGVRVNSYKDGNLRTKEYVSLSDREYIAVIPSGKTYLRMTLTDQLWEKMQKEYGDPRMLVAKFMEYEYTKLGRDTIDGIEVEGIECHDPRIARGLAANIAGEMISNVTARLWAAVENNLPVKLQIEVFTDNGEKALDMVVYGYQWDIQIDPREFEPDIPDDYKMGADAELSLDEKSVVEGLGFFAEYADGKYPSEMSAMAMVRELRAALLARFGGEPPWPPKPGDANRALSLEMAIRFYAGLVIEDKDPAYHGDKVTAEFPHAVLMRWKIEDGKYRVIFADLIARDVTAEELAELEAAPLNTGRRAIKPQPANGADGTNLTGLKLSWMPGAGAAEHKVYFSTSPKNLSLLTTINSTDFDGLPALNRSTTYYWRVDAVSAGGGVTPGELWSFSTGGLVAHWKFDDGSGKIAADSSGNGHNGTLIGDTSWAKGVLNGALAFDGDGDYVDIGKSPDFDIENQITVSAWIKVNAFDRDWQSIVAKGDRAWRIQRNWNTNTLEFACSGLIVPGTDWGQIFGSINVNDGHWHHVAGVYDEEKIYLYIDGSLDASASAPGKIRVNDQPVYIGENSQMPNRFWNGLIDDVRICSYALSKEEISEIAQNALLLSLPE